MADTTRQPGEQVLERTRPKAKDPEVYRVLLHNDDYTTMQFVIEVLEEIFSKSPAEAFRVMMHVHTRGQGICGTYPHEVAETKVSMVHDRAQDAGYPLRASMEKS